MELAQVYANGGNWHDAVEPGTEIEFKTCSHNPTSAEIMIT
jgi:hypothetical protein